MEEVYITRPKETARLFHIFKEKDGRSFCGSWAMLVVKPSEKYPIYSVAEMSQQQDLCGRCVEKYTKQLTKNNLSENMEKGEKE